MKKTKVITLDSDLDYEFEKLEEVYEEKGKLSSQFDEDKLMHLIMDGEEEKIEEGKLIEQSINQGMFSFNASNLFENLVNNFNVAKEIYGESFLRAISGESLESLKRNIKLPEFQRKLKEKINNKVGSLEEEGLIDSGGNVTHYGEELAAINLYMEEIKELESRGFIGEKVNKKLSLYGERKNVRPFKRSDRYRDIAIKNSVKQAIRKKHKKVEISDLKTYEREAKGKISIVYALDSSGSMKGRKIGLCKKAGIALAYNAINEKDKVGLLVFGDKVEISLEPTDDFMLLLRNIVKIRAKKETNFVETIKKSLELFKEENETKHLVLISDGLANVGEDPEKETLNAVEEAAFNGITISFVGINMDEEGEELAKKIVEMGNGRLYIVKDLKELDFVVLDDYYSI